MKFPTITRCCCCSLRVGSFLFGVYGVISGFFWLVWTITTVALFNSDTEKETDELIWIEAYHLASSVLTTAISIFLLIGVMKERPSFLLPFIIWTLINLVLSCIYLIASHVYVISWYEMIAWIINIGNVLLSVLALLCVYSHRKELLTTIIL